MKKILLALALVAGLSSSHAATFGSGANEFTLDFTSIGNAGQEADPLTGVGYVPYNFSMGTYSISQNQIQAVANATGQYLGGVFSGDQPAGLVTWYQAATFVNWLNTSSGYQAAYNLTYSGGAYTMALWQSGQAGYDPSNPYRNSLSLYVLPSHNEWYKAAYGLSDGSGYTLYPTASNSAPEPVESGTTAGTVVINGAASYPASVYEAGGLSSYGTMGQGGNIVQWVETSVDGNSDPAANRLLRGGAWGSPGWTISSTAYVGDYNPNQALTSYGFRVAEISGNAVPEPSTYALFGLGALVLIVAYRRKVA